MTPKLPVINVNIRTLVLCLRIIIVYLKSILQHMNLRFPTLLAHTVSLSYQNSKWICRKISERKLWHSATAYHIRVWISWDVTRQWKASFLRATSSSAFGRIWNEWNSINYAWQKQWWGIQSFHLLTNWHKLNWCRNNNVYF